MEEKWPRRRKREEKTWKNHISDLFAGFLGLVLVLVIVAVVLAIMLCVVVALMALIHGNTFSTEFSRALDLLSH